MTTTIKFQERRVAPGMDLTGATRRSWIKKKGGILEIPPIMHNRILIVKALGKPV
jgi:hypothetical protein